MIEMTLDARELLDHYLRRARLSLRGTPVDAGEVERDISAHIDEALAGREAPVGAEDLRTVLDRLGSPTQWVPEEEVAPWRRILARLTDGPEDWRLPYWCLGLTLVGLLTLPIGIGIVLLLGAALLSRATISLAEEKEEALGARRWLIYPVLVFFSVFLILIPLILPVAGMGAFAGETWPGGSSVYAASGIGDSLVRLIAAIAAITGAWWIVLAGIAALAARPIRWLLVPVANRFRPVHASWLALAGLMLLLASGGVVMLL